LRGGSRRKAELTDTDVVTPCLLRLLWHCRLSPVVGGNWRARRYGTHGVRRWSLGLFQACIIRARSSQRIIHILLPVWWLLMVVLSLSGNSLSSQYPSKQAEQHVNNSLSYIPLDALKRKRASAPHRRLGATSLATQKMRTLDLADKIPKCRAKEIKSCKSLKEQREFRLGAQWRSRRRGISRPFILGIIILGLRSIIVPLKVSIGIRYINKTSIDHLTTPLLGTGATRVAVCSTQSPEMVLIVYTLLIWSMLLSRVIQDVVYYLYMAYSWKDTGFANMDPSNDMWSSWA
jgi:hypothetical protein